MLKTDMPSILVQLDDATFKALDRIAPPAKRKRTQFIRDAVKTAIRKQEYAQMRQAYGKQPDSAKDADNWAGCEEFKA
jgi:predicted transcriptional regulator